MEDRDRNESSITRPRTSIKKGFVQGFGYDFLL